MAQPNAVFSLGGPPPNFTFPLPLSTTDPDDEPLVYVRLNREWLKYLIGACYALRQEATWLSDNYSLVCLSIARANMLLDMLMTELCEPVCADEIRLAGNTLQLSTDGGATWANVPNGGGAGDPADPRTDEPLLPHRTGDNRRCLAAANAVACFAELHREVVEWYNASALPLIVLGALALILGVFFPVSWMVFGLSLSATTLATVLLTHTASLNMEAFDETVQDELRCIFYCRMDTDGQLNETSFADVLADIAAKSGDIWELIAYYVENVGGFAGLNNAGTTTSIASADCGDCLCGEWCYVWFGQGGSYENYTLLQGSEVVETGIEAQAGTPPDPDMGRIRIDLPEGDYTIDTYSATWTETGGCSRIVIMLNDEGPWSGSGELVTHYCGGARTDETLSGVNPGDFLGVQVNNDTAFPSCFLAGFQLRGRGENPFGADNCS